MVVRISHIVSVAVSLVTATVYSVLSYQQWKTGWVPSWDLGIFSQLAQAYAHGQVPIVPIKGEGFNLLGDHFHPILVLLGPIWWLWPSPLSLLITQAVLFGVSAYPLTRLAADRFGTVLGALLGLGYGLSWGLQSAVVSQFHEIAFAVVMFAFGLVAYLERRWLASALWIGALVFVKEDLGFTVALFAVVLWMTQRNPLSPSWRPINRQQRLALWLFGWGLVWLAASVLVILPSLNPGQRYDYTDRLSGLGASLGSADTYLALAMLAATTGLIGLRSALSWLMVPTLAWRLAGNVSFYWGWEWHYSAPLMPIAVAALLDQLAPQEPITENQPEPPNTPRPTRVRWIALALLIASTLSLGKKQPLLRLGDDQYWNTWRVPGMTAALAAVPPGSKVVSDLALMAYLVPDRTVYWLGTSHPTPDYVVRNEQSTAWDDEARADLAAWAAKRYGESYQMIVNRDHFVVAKRVS